jgi:EAL domain-containing protein (putative c-di-GMP-specific phosphodiesterase class I)/DNA-binding NarL/FixJ family response regulator
VERIRVLVADDDDVVRAALAELVDSEESLELAAVAGDAEEAIDLAIRERPDVALVDVKMPGGGGMRASREIRISSLKTKVLALSAYEDRASVLDMLRSGAVGYLVKGTPASEIVRMIHDATRGEVVLSREVTADVLEELTGRLHREGREEEVLEEQLGRIRRVVDAGGPSMVFQPIVELATGRVVGYEALSRFPGPQRPVEAWFAEATAIGLRLDLELAAIGKALGALPELPVEAFVSVNATPDTVASRALHDLVAGAVPSRVVVEITEHAPVRDYDKLGEAIRRLRDGGARVAVDDAGAGFASLRHILQLSPDIIKIDNSLTHDIHRDSARRALAAGLISFAAELGATIVAEGIEEQQELDVLRKLDVRFGQGYFIARPAALVPPALNGIPA